jgi:hypothetical protein
MPKNKMRGDLLQTQEDFEKVLEDYFMIIPPDNESFDLEKCISWDYNDFDRTITFYFDNEWDLEEFNDKMNDCPAKGVMFDVGNNFDGVDRKNLKIIIEGNEGGLY